MRFLALLLISVCCAIAIVPPEAPPSILEDVAVVYFGPRPSSEFNPAMVGPTQILRSPTRSDITVDEVLGTITLPLYKGSLVDGSGDVWFIVTDASSRDIADLLGVSYSPKLSLITDTNLMRTVTGDINENLSSLVFSSGFVDFSPVRTLIPGDAPNFYPLGTTAAVGAIGDTQYTPLVMHETLNVVMNAPIIASSNVTEDELNRFCDGIFPETIAEAHAIMHDKVVSICPRDGHVTLQMTDAFSYGRPFWYLALESSDLNHAILESATHVPLLGQISTNCFELDSCPTQIAMTVVNGVTNQNFTISENLTSNPLRQGLFSAALSEGSPLHVMGEITTLGIHNSPLWDIFAFQWTDQAIMQNLRVRVHDIFEIFGLNTLGWINNWPSGEELTSSGIVFNAPPVYRLY